MPPKQPRTKSERRLQDAKMAAATGTSAAAPRAGPDKVASGDAAASELHTLPDNELTVAAQTAPSADSPITYVDMVRAVQDAMAPLMAAQAEQLHQAI